MMVIVVRHQHIGMAKPPGAATSICQCLEKGNAVFVIQEDVLPMIPPAPSHDRERLHTGYAVASA